MKRPENMPFPLYREALKRLNRRIDGHLAGTVIHRGRPFLVADNTIPKVKPLAAAVRHALI